MTASVDVIVVGGGPVGLLAANFFGVAGLRTLLVERKTSLAPGSRAIGIMPPSLEILDRAGLAAAIIDSGVRVVEALVHGARARLGQVRFDVLDGAYPFILAVPQDQTERHLTAGLDRFADVVVRRGSSALRAESCENAVRLHMEIDGRTETVDGRFLLACDGDRSTIREASGIDCTTHRHRQTFLMGDFRDKSDLGNTAHLFFTPQGAVESFPLPGNVRRWIIQTESFQKNPEEGLIENTVEKRTGYSLSSADRLGYSPFGIKRQLCNKYFQGSVLLAGDSAHVMPPIGGQGMNTGFADAWMATRILISAIREDSPIEPLLETYSRCRGMAAKTATSRARLSMGVGTLTGRIASGLRNGLIWCALKTLAPRWLAPRFAMRTVPFGTIEKMSSAFPGPP